MSSDAEGTDALTLIADDLHADLVGYINGDGDVETCLDDFLAIEREEDPDAAILETDDGPSLEISADGTMLAAMIVSGDGAVSTATLFTCTRISDEAVVRLSVTGESDILAAERDAIQQLLDGLLVIPATEQRSAPSAHVAWRSHDALSETFADQRPLAGNLSRPAVSGLLAACPWRALRG